MNFVTKFNIMKYQTILLAAGAGTRSNLKINKVFIRLIHKLF